jgi:DNA-directed RNA polymerase subunit M/transcription elongation factor TFIIS
MTERLAELPKTQSVDMPKGLSDIKYFELGCPNSISLNSTYYTDPKYNHIRRGKLILFGECLGENDAMNQKIGGELTQIKRTHVKTALESFMRVDVINIITKYLFPLVYDKEFIIKNLERGCMNRTLKKAKTHNIRCVWTDTKFIDLYHSICYKIAINLDPESPVQSDYMKKKIINGEYKISNVANLSSKELCPTKYEKIDQKIERRTNVDRKIKYSELYRCSKCKRNQTTTERRYNRSLDEGVSLVITCVYCYNTWSG